MKKSLLSLAVIAVSLSACDTTPKYNINGTITGGEANNVYLLQRQGYTIIKRCIKKDAIERIEPNFLCRPLISREAVQIESTDDFLDKVFNGSVDKLFAALLGGNKLSKDDIEKLKQMVNELDGE